MRSAKKRILIGVGGDSWIATLGGAGGDIAQAITVDGSGNIYVCGYTDSAGAGGNDFLIAKYDASGAIQWQRVLGGGVGDVGYAITVDGSGNVYVCGYTGSAGAGVHDCLIAKYDASGSLQWQRVLGGSNYDYGQAIAVDDSGNVYVGGSTNSTGAGGSDCLIAKYSSTSSLQWQRVLGGASGDNCYAIATDGSGNVYVGGSTNSAGAGGNDCLIAKYDATGAIQWQRTLGGGTNDAGRAIAVDGLGNVYVGGYTDSAGAGQYDFLIAKYSSTGSLQWQRVLGGASGDNCYAIATDGSGNVYVGGSTNSAGAGGSDFLIAKLPDDGSLTGTYGSFIYQASALTDQSASLTGAVSSLTDQSASLTGAVSSLTDQPSALTSTLHE